MPDLGLPRLLLAGRKVQYVRDIRLGSRVERTTVLTNISEKRTASGRRAVATIQHDIRDTEASAPAVVEVQTYLLLEGDTRSRPSDNGPGALPKFAHAITMAPDETLLFQYSALCFNSHKIHLDRQWARDVEGFPDLVVNGGVTTLLLTEFARRELGLTLSAIEMKNLAPLFCDRTITLGAEPHGVRWRLTVWDDLGRLAAEMEAEVQ
jgi:3-methylfumaryl-CoA hydratase